MHMTDVAIAEQMFRVIQSIPSPKAEPFKMWIERKTGRKVISPLNLKITVEVKADTPWRREAFLAPFAPVSRLAAS